MREDRSRSSSSSLLAPVETAERWRRDRSSDPLVRLVVGCGVAAAAGDGLLVRGPAVAFRLGVRLLVAAYVVRTAAGAVEIALLLVGAHRGILSGWCGRACLRSPGLA